MKDTDHGSARLRRWRRLPALLLCLAATPATPTWSMWVDRLAGLLDPASLAKIGGAQAISYFASLAPLQPHTKSICQDSYFSAAPGPFAADIKLTLLTPKSVQAFKVEDACKLLRFGRLELHIDTSKDNDPTILIDALDRRFGHGEHRLTTTSPGLRWSLFDETIVLTPDASGDSADLVVEMQPK